MPVLGPPCANYANYVPDVWLVGDSITTGVEATIIPGFRYIPWNLFAGKIHYVGSQSFAGTDNSLAANPQHEGHNGYTIAQLLVIVQQNEAIYSPDVVQLEMGINTITAGADAPTVLAQYSTMLDTVWNLRTKGWLQIVPVTILKILDPAFDAVVQAVNAGLPALIAGKSYASHVTLNAGFYNGIADQTVGGGYAAGGIHPNDTGFTTNLGTVVYNGLVTPVAKARPIA